ncbi:MAG: NUDIX hydrolase [Hyphomicrobiales bacterium]
MHDPSRPASLLAAAALILVRQLGGEVQIYLLRRSPTSWFMPGVFVFPGGLVDAGDFEGGFWKGHVDLEPERVVDRLGQGLGYSDALSYGIAAIRETFEEAGVFLASLFTSTAAAMERAHQWRLRESPRKGWFRQLVESGAWSLALSALYHWAHWITPVGMPRRFDTRFFMAAMPEGQNCRPDQREATEGIWLSPRQALAANVDGRVPLSPPTLVTLQELLSCPTLERLQYEAGRRGRGAPIFPRLISLEDNRGAVIIEPWDPLYGAETIRIDTEKLSASVLPAGEPFSRLWNDRGVWKPVSLS